MWKGTASCYYLSHIRKRYPYGRDSVLFVVHVNKGFSEITYGHSPKFRTLFWHWKRRSVHSAKINLFDHAFWEVKAGILTQGKVKLNFFK